MKFKYQFNQKIRRFKNLLIIKTLYTNYITIKNINI